MLETHGGQVKRERYIYIFSGANTTEFRDNFPGFACWGALILRKLQSLFCACSAQPGKMRTGISVQHQDHRTFDGHRLSSSEWYRLRLYIMS